LGLLVGRGVRQLFVYTSMMFYVFNYPQQLQDAFRSVQFGNLVRVEYWPDADHIFTGLPQQKRLVQTITGWTTANWPKVNPEAVLGTFTQVASATVGSG